jgi:putative transposase
MREPRLNPRDMDTWHHCYNHATCTAEEYIFGDEERKKFEDILLDSLSLYAVDAVSFSVMSNHYHAIIRTRCEPVSEEEAIARYADYFPTRAPLVPGSKKCRRWQEKMNDLSDYMKHVQQTFSRWYNRTRKARRKGKLWGQRYKNTVLGDGMSVLRCFLYVEANPLRAGLVERADEFTQTSCSQWFAQGTHPLFESMERVFLPLMGDVMRVETMDELKEALRAELVACQREMQEKAAADAGAIGAVIEAPFAPGSFTVDAEAEVLVLEAAVAARDVADAPAAVRIMDLCCRMRCWTDGLVIGPAEFVREMMRKARGIPVDSGHGLMRLETGDDQDDLYAWRRLRASGD